MIGPPLSVREIRSHLEREVAKVEAMGAGRAAAIRIVANQIGTEPIKVADALALR